MPNLNKVFLMGNLTRDPQLTYLPTNQTAVCEIGMAVMNIATALARPFAGYQSPR